MAFRAERVFIVTAILMIGLGLALAISRGAIASAANSNGSVLWTLTFALVVVAAGGSAWLRSGASVIQVADNGLASVTASPRPMRRPAPGFSFPSEAVVPALLVGGFTLFVQFFESGMIQTLILVLAALSFASVYWAQLHVIDIRDRYFGVAQAILNVLAHLCAFLLFATIYGLKTRSIISGSAVAVVTALILYELLLRDAAWHHSLGQNRVVRLSAIRLMAAACGVVLGELTWGLNYWAALTTLLGGAFLLVVFYVAHGLISHYLDGALTKQTIVEFGTVAIAATLAIFSSAFIIR